jgi:DNA-binding MarR family transcriptional regulator
LSDGVRRYRIEKCVPRAGSKQALIVAMLSKDEGATLDALIAATGWLPHTTPAALTGLRKRGYLVERSRHETKGSIYHIARDKALGRA